MASKLANPVRLACVKHAASVRPEPESNSPLKKMFRLLGSKLKLSVGAKGPPAQNQTSFVIKRGLTNLAVSQPPAFACQRADARSTLLSSQPANCAEASSASDL